MTDLLADLAKYPLIAFVVALLDIAATIATLHFTFANIRKTNAESFKLLWARIDELEKKIVLGEERREEERKTYNKIIEALQGRIRKLEQRLREYGIPFPADEEVTEPLPAVRKQDRGSSIFGIKL